MARIFNFLLLFLSFILTNEKIGYISTYNEVNTFKTIAENKSFIIFTKIKSKAYFDSFDKNSIIYITQNINDFLSENDEKITGKFYTIEPNITYYVRNYLYTIPSVFKMYLYPFDLSANHIYINDQSFLYLEKNKVYVLNFKENKNKKMIKLSRKTLNSEVQIIKILEKVKLNKNNLYYEIEEGFTDIIYLEVFKEDAFIEFLSDYGDYEILEDLSKHEYKIQKDIVLIKIPKNKKDFEIELISYSNFNASFSYGFSNKVNYYYSSGFDKTISAIKGNNYNYNYKINFKINNQFKDISLLKNEFLSFAIKVERNHEQMIYLSYKQYGYFIEHLLNEKMEQSICKEIINNLNNLLELYVYLDIAQNPPPHEDNQNYHHKPVNLKEELNKVSTNNRNFYEFYQEIIKILGSTKDLHLNIKATKTPGGIYFNNYYVSLPFYFIIKKYNNEDRIFIEKYVNPYYNNEKERVFINSHLDTPLKFINNIDPIDYIQNWNKYRQIKNIHAQFTYNIGKISFFNLNDYPVDLWDLYNEYEFEDNKILRIYYHSNMGNVGAELDLNFLNILKGKIIPFQIPQMDETEENYLVFKDLKKQSNIIKENIIKWDIEYQEYNNKIFKCRVDEINRVNVLFQNSFSFDLKIITAIAFDCARLFYTNNYPLIIIESENGGGNAFLAILMQQIFQIRTTKRGFKSSFRFSEMSKNFFKQYFGNYIIADAKTCKIISSIDEIYEVIDHYYYNNKQVDHRRSNIIDIENPKIRDSYNNFKKEYNDSPNIKNPTDIIIFTDSFTYSAASTFIKQFQNSGGAIVVGYFGNPKIKGKDSFDASQSYSTVERFANTEMHKNLEKLGIEVEGVTFREFFDDSCNSNPIPEEYIVKPVDYRVDIYSHYSDNLYDSFIKEGINIHKKFNEENICNPKNERLLLYDAQCRTIKDSLVVQGGYKCGGDGKWNKTKCEYYFCEIGYYYDHYQNKCIQECKFGGDNKRAFIIHEDNINKEFLIEKDYSYIFMTYNFKRFYYLFETSEKQMCDNPKIFFVNAYQDVNLENEGGYNFKINIKTIDPIINQNINFQYFTLKHKDSFNIFFDKGKRMFILQSNEDYYFYLKNVLNTTNSSIKILKYNNDMTYEDILQINNKSYNDYKGDMLFLKQNELYYFYYDFNEYEQINLFLAPIRKEIIEFNSNSELILYLEKGKKYLLDCKNFKNIVANIMIKLDRKTKDSEVVIKGKNIILNSDNLYYEIGNFNESLDIEVRNNNALIEFLFKLDANDYEIIDIKEDSDIYNLKKEINFLKIPKEYSSKIINFYFKENENLIFMVNPTYTIAPYCFIYTINEYNNKIPMNNIFNFNITSHYKDNALLMKDEFYYVIIYLKMKTNLQLRINVSMDTDYEQSQNDKEETKTNNYKAIIIIGIIIISILFILTVFVTILFIRNKKFFDKMKNQVNSISFKLDSEINEEEETPESLTKLI